MFLGLATGRASAFGWVRRTRCQMIENAKPGDECLEKEKKKKKVVEISSKYANICWGDK